MKMKQHRWIYNKHTYEVGDKPSFIGAFCKGEFKCVAVYSIIAS